MAEVIDVYCTKHEIETIVLSFYLADLLIILIQLFFRFPELFF